MVVRRSAERRAALADRLLRKVESPRAPQRLQDYGFQRILARAAEGTRAAERSWYRNPALRRRAVVLPLTVLLLLGVGTSGTYAASADASPGSTLYGCKIFFERARVALTLSRSSDARLEMDFCDRRIRELQDLTESGEYRAWERWSREYRRNLGNADSLLEALSPEESASLAARFQAQLEEHYALMQRLEGTTPQPYLPILRQASQECMKRLQRYRHRHGMEDGERGQPQSNPEAEETKPGGGTENGGYGGTGESGPYCPSPSEVQREVEGTSSSGSESPLPGMPGDGSAPQSGQQESGGPSRESGGADTGGFRGNHCWK